MIPEEVVKDWVKNKKRIQDRLNRIKKRLKKYSKQEKHFEMRLKIIKQHENANKENPATNSSGVQGGTSKQIVEVSS